MIEAVISLGSVPLTPLRRSLHHRGSGRHRPYLPDHDAMLLENHGAVTVGADLCTAYYRMETLELWAKIRLNARLLGEKEISEKNIGRLLELRKTAKVTGRHPGYRHYRRDK